MPRFYLPQMLQVVLLCSVVVAASWSVENRDRVILRGNAFPAIVERETREGVEYRITRTQPNVQSRRWSEVVDIIYHGMDGGNYRAGMDAMRAGRYEEAAVRFQSLASSATREWEGAYGFLRLGEAWEQAGDFEQAAAAFASLATAYPEHRFWLDAVYRRGINLARAGNTAEAQAVIAELQEYRTQNPAVGRGPEFRANAIQAAMTAQAGDIREAQRIANRVALAPRDGDTWFHWGSFWAGYLYELGQYRESAQQFQRMLTQVGDNPVQRAQLSLGLGLSLVRSNDKPNALMELLRIDVLPYGSPAQRCQAQFEAGRILIEKGQAAKDSEDSRTSDFARVNIDRGMLLLQAAANSVSDHPSKLEARTLLERLQAEAEDAAEAEQEADAAE